MKDLWHYGKRDSDNLNHRTATDLQYAGQKKEKKIIRFNKNSYFINLTTGELGPNYETV